jgi:hypothetical protein
LVAATVVVKGLAAALAALVAVQEEAHPLSAAARPHQAKEMSVPPTLPHMFIRLAAAAARGQPVNFHRPAINLALAAQGQHLHLLARQ